MAIPGCDVRGGISVVGGGAQVDIPALQRAQDVEVAVQCCEVHGVVAGVGGGVQVSTGVLELPHDLDKPIFRRKHQFVVEDPLQLFLFVDAGGVVVKKVSSNNNESQLLTKTQAL